MLSLTIEIDVVPQQRVRFKGKAFDPVRSRNFKEELAWLVKSKLDADFAPISKPCQLQLEIYRDCKQPYSGNFGDVDNLAKGVMDACTGILWTDDRFVTTLIVHKYTDKTPHIILTLD